MIMIMDEVMRYIPRGKNMDPYQMIEAGVKTLANADPDRAYRIPPADPDHGWVYHSEAASAARAALLIAAGLTRLGIRPLVKSSEEFLAGQLRESLPAIMADKENAMCNGRIAVSTARARGLAAAKNALIHISVKGGLTSYRLREVAEAVLNGEFDGPIWADQGIRWVRDPA